MRGSRGAGRRRSATASRPRRGGRARQGRRAARTRAGRRGRSRAGRRGRRSASRRSRRSTGRPRAARGRRRGRAGRARPRSAAAIATSARPRARGIGSVSGSSAASAAGAGNRWVTAPHGSGSGSPARSVSRAGLRAGGGDADLLAEHGADGDLGRVGAARHAAAGRGRDELAQQRVGAERRVDLARVGVRVEQRAAQRGRGRLVARSPRSSRQRGRASPRSSAITRRAVGQPHAAAVGRPVDLLHPGHGARGEERQQRGGVQRKLGGQFHVAVQRAPAPVREPNLQLSGLRPNNCGLSACGSARSRP